MKSWLRLACALSVAGSLSACSDTDDKGPEGTPRPLELTILHINDHHSNLDSKAKTLKLKNAAGTRVDVSVDFGGFPRVTKAIEELAAASPNVLKLHAGDALTGTLYFNRAGAAGEADAAMMNTVCFDAMTVGNHEFDKGDAGLKTFIDLLHAGSCKTPVISANVQFGASSPLKSTGQVLPSVVLTRDDQKIGIVGLTIAAKTKQSSSPNVDTLFEDEATAAQREIDALRKQGIDKIIVMSHIGYENDRALIPKLSGVDVVVGGDSHTLLGPDSLAEYGVGTPAGPYGAELINKDGQKTCLVQAWEYSQVVGELKVSFDARGQVTACNGKPHVLMGELSTAKAFSDADLTAFQADVGASGLLRITNPSAAAAAKLKPFKDKVDVFKAQVVAVAPTELCSRRVPGGPGSADYGRSGVDCNALGSVDLRGGDIQQIVAQAYVDIANAQYGGADISLQSGGGVRIPLKGDVTAANVIEVLPFGNMLYRLDITGAEAKSMIEDGLHTVFGGATVNTGAYPYTGGLRFDVTSTAPRGQRASNVEYFDRESKTWKALDLAKTYKLFVLSFNATGGDGYTTLRDIPAARRSDIGVLDADVFQTWIEGLPKNGAGRPVITKLSTEVYSTKSFNKPAEVTPTSVSLEPLGRFSAGQFGVSAAEIPTFDAASKRIFVVNAQKGTIDVLDGSTPGQPTSIGEIDASSITPGAEINSIASFNGLLAIAIQADDKTDPGYVAIYRASNLAKLGHVQVGALPDMLTFTPDGLTVLVANEGEPSDDYQTDPEGSISVIDVRDPTNPVARTAGFAAFNNQKAALIASGVRIFGANNPTVAKDLEPEYITVSTDSKTAWVSLQEANAFAKVDIASATVTNIIPLGYKDHGVAGKGLDASDKDGAINIKTWPGVRGLYMPDAIASYSVGGQTYIVSANEGDSRAWFSDEDAYFNGDASKGFVEEFRVKHLINKKGFDERASEGDLPPQLRQLAFGGLLNPEIFGYCGAVAGDPKGCRDDKTLGRLNITWTLGYRTDANGAPVMFNASGVQDPTGNRLMYDALYAFGGRSFSIWDANGQLVWDSGDQFEQYLASDACRLGSAKNIPCKDYFNSNHEEGGPEFVDSRSDNKGPEPEGIALGKIGSKTFAFIGLERMGGVMIYDISNPQAPVFVNYINTREIWNEKDPSANLAAHGDLGPEGLVFVPADKSPNNQPLLIVGNEVSGTTAVYQVNLLVP